MDLEEILQTRFKLPSFRKGQRDIISGVLNRKDILAVMPTGSGKSLCYQLPSLFTPGIVVVISPLISLMEDQVKGLDRLGIATGFIHSGQTTADRKDVFARMKTATHFILFLAPERVQKERFAEWVKKAKISLFAIDESHCVSQWGPDFRKDYYRLGLLRELRPDVPILALTATATPEVLKDIVKQLKLKLPERHIHGFYRPNLYYQVESCANEGEKMEWVRQALKQNPTGRVLIYCGTRKQCEEISENLSNEFQGVGFYHAGMDAEERTKIQKDYENDKLRILAATNAFGMGIDHPDVRLVIHYQMPANVEGYYQEMGRAGRDEKHSTCLLLYSKKDKGLHAYFIQKSEAESSIINRRWLALNTITQYAEGGECRHAGILTYFRDAFRLKACGHCDVCLPDSDRKIAKPKPVFKDMGKTKVLKRSKSDKKKPPSADAPLTDAEKVRYEVLKDWRKEFADEKDIPAFLIFSNRTLHDLAVRNPKTLTELERVYGFGPQKTEHLGAVVLEKLSGC